MNYAPFYNQEYMNPYHYPNHAQFRPFEGNSQLNNKGSMNEMNMMAYPQ